MVDTVDQATRSRIMARVRSKNSSPEMFVRRLLHRAGYRYRLHVKGLPGTPDLVFRGKKKVIFVHGCFWHRHERCVLARLPKSRPEFWIQKLETNRLRDRANEVKLRELGWETMTVWECELRNQAVLLDRLRSFLECRACG
jgi:DNA mismatch endonuclease (patch repair protein)